jgi:ribosomal protein S24E
MQLEIARQRENKTLKRTEVEFKANDLKVVPSRKELKPKIAAMLNAKEELLVITKIGHSFGSRDITVEANVYQDAEALKNAEAKHLLERGFGKKKKEEAEKPAEGKKEESREKKEEGGKGKEGEGKKEAGKKEKAGEGKETQGEKAEKGKEAWKKPAEGKEADRKGKASEKEAQ